MIMALNKNLLTTKHLGFFFFFADSAGDLSACWLLHIKKEKKSFDKEVPAVKNE